MSRSDGDAVNQALTVRGRAAILTFHSYQRSQGGKYECKVDLPGNYTEKLLAFISECTLCDCIIKSVNDTHSSAVSNRYVLHCHCVL